MFSPNEHDTRQFTRIIDLLIDERVTVNFRTRCETYGGPSKQASAKDSLRPDPSL